MLFNTIDFAIFLPIVFGLYWLLKTTGIRSQNFLLLLSSYFFYGWWDWRFLGLILFSTIVDFTIGIYLEKTSAKRHRLALLITSLSINLGLLFFFKYFNFFLDNLNSAFEFFGEPIGIRAAQIVLPVGISFYTFQTLSYTIDIYRKKINASKDLIVFASFVSFFPQLVAGPIERASHLLPQFERERKFDYVSAISGLRQILWGLFKKVVIADNCARVVNSIFSNHAELDGSHLFIGALFFTFQIYGDFSGYSDIAIGTSRLFGFDLMKNFSFPYFSRDIAEFWRRWHISLSTWFRDYLYIPLGGSRGSLAKKIRNTFIIFIVSGFWHGANWTFIVWGALNALYFLPLLLSEKNRINMHIVAHDRKYPTPKELGSMLLTFSLTIFTWIFFRSENLGEALAYISGLFRNPHSYIELGIYLKHYQLFLLLFFFLVVEWMGRKGEFALDRLFSGRSHYAFRFSFYQLIVLLIYWFNAEQQTFIYFQF